MPTQAYFDNAATSFPKPECVYDFADSIYRSYGINIGRGTYDLANNAENIVEKSRQRLKHLLDCAGREVVYTASATDALNRILLGLKLPKTATVYLSPFEHNAVTRVIHHLEILGAVSVELLPFDSNTLMLDIDGMKDAFERKQPSLIVMSHASNVCGAILPVEAIATTAKEYEAITVVDMSQTAGLIPLRLSMQCFDFAVFSGHKTLYAPFGIGGFICNEGESRLKPVLYGGNGVNSINQEMPNDIRLMEEIGSQNIYAIAGLYASTGWLLEQGSNVSKYENAARDKLLALLRSYSNIQIVGDNMLCDRIGVVSCLFNGYSPDEIGSILNDLNVAVRTGLHCAPSAHRFLGTLPAGTIRFSVSAFTSEQDFDVLSDALDYIAING